MFTNQKLYVIHSIQSQVGGKPRFFYSYPRYVVNNIIEYLHQLFFWIQTLFLPPRFLRESSGMLSIFTIDPVEIYWKYIMSSRVNNVNMQRRISKIFLTYQMSTTWRCDFQLPRCNCMLTCNLVILSCDICMLTCSISLLTHSLSFWTN